MPGGPPLASRIAGISAAMAGLLNQLAERESQRHEPGMADLVLGNPQEMPLPGFVASAPASTPIPQHKDWFAYKFSEPERPGRGRGCVAPDGAACPSSRRTSP